MSGECNWCGGPHAEGGCKADRELIYSNGMAAGYASGHNDRNEAFNALRTRLAACEEALREIAKPDTSGQYLINPEGDRLLFAPFASVQWRVDRAEKALRTAARNGFTDGK